VGSDCRVDHGGIGLQAHAAIEPVDEDRGDQRPLLGHPGLLLDDGGQDHGLLGGLDRQSLGALGPKLGQGLIQGGAHAGNQRGAFVVPGIVVGLRQQRALGGRRAGFAAEALGGGDQGDHLDTGQALGHGELAHHGLAAVQDLEGAAHGDVRGKGVLTGLEVARRALQPDAQLEQKGVLDHPGVFQLGGDDAEARAARHDQVRVRGKGAGTLEALQGEERRAAQDQGQRDDRGEET
jgi:hypothetical protein